MIITNQFVEIVMKNIIKYNKNVLKKVLKIYILKQFKLNLLI
jgi:hypothetical protein